MDVFGAAVVSVPANGGVHRFPVPSAAATVIRRRDKTGFVIATERGIVLANEDLTVFSQLADVTDDPALRTNDGGCDPRGAFVIGTMGYGEEPDAGSVYRVTGDRSVTQILTSVTISNGVRWSADGTQVYYIDSPTRCVDAFRVDDATGEWSHRRTHIRIETSGGFPDGMAIDDEDGLWVALWGAGAVNHYDNKGQLVETIAVPGVTQVSSCAFGGDERNRLFITTSRQGLAAHQEPNAGAVFCVDTSVRGVPELEFAG